MATRLRPTGLNLHPLLMSAAVSALLLAPTPAAAQPAGGLRSLGSPGEPSRDWVAEGEINKSAFQQEIARFNTQLTRLIDIASPQEISIEQYVEMIRETQVDGPLNVLIAGELRNSKIPSFTLNRTRVITAFQLLPLLTGNQAILVEFDSDTGDDPMIRIFGASGFAPDFGHRAHPIKKILELIEPEILLQSLERGIVFADAGVPKIQIAMEAETGLLFVKGTEAQLDLVEDILGAIRTNNDIPWPGMGGMGMGGMGGGGMQGMGGGMGMGGTFGGMGMAGMGMPGPGMIGGGGSGGGGYGSMGGGIASISGGGIDQPSNRIVGGDGLGRYVIRDIGGQLYLFVAGEPHAYSVDTPEADAAIARALGKPAE